MIVLPPWSSDVRIPPFYEPLPCWRHRINSIPIPGPLNCQTSEHLLFAGFEIHLQRHLVSPTFSNHGSGGGYYGYSATGVHRRWTTTRTGWWSNSLQTGSRKASPSIYFAPDSDPEDGGGEKWQRDGPVLDVGGGAPPKTSDSRRSRGRSLPPCPKERHRHKRCTIGTLLGSVARMVNAQELQLANHRPL